MHLKRLQFAEQDFLNEYPGGFDHPEFVAIRKKHNVNKLSEFCQDALKKTRFKQTDQILEDWMKIISRSSMISMFEKPRFKSFINTRNSDEKKALVDSLKMLIHGKKQQGFELQRELLKQDKLAKWSIISAAPAYYNMQEEIFMKPTTVKGIVNYYELEGITYKPTPSWDFYEKYKNYILEMKQHVSEDLSPNNPAFCGFLMMTLPK